MASEARWWDEPDDPRERVLRLRMMAILLDILATRRARGDGEVGDGG